MPKYDRDEILRRTIATRDVTLPLVTIQSEDGHLLCHVALSNRDEWVVVTYKRGSDGTLTGSDSEVIKNPTHCRLCDLDLHRCPGCGTPLDHSETCCDPCKQL